MKKCGDCIHADICKQVNGGWFSHEHIAYCKDFKDRTKYVEVVHGRWEVMHYEGGILDGTNFDKCSACGYERIIDDVKLKTAFNYCPNCGARMNDA